MNGELVVRLGTVRCKPVRPPEMHECMTDSISAYIKLTPRPVGAAFAVEGACRAAGPPADAVDEQTSGL